MFDNAGWGRIDGRCARRWWIGINLFGSTVRAEHRPESDIDFLVVMPEGTHKRQTAQGLYRRLRGLPVSVDILVTTEIDLERQKDNPGLIYGTILQEGRELYAA